MLAEWTGLEPATPGVTGRYSNQLNYHSIFSLQDDLSACYTPTRLTDKPYLAKGHSAQARRTTDKKCLLFVRRLSMNRRALIRCHGAEVYHKCRYGLTRSAPPHVSYCKATVHFAGPRTSQCVSSCIAMPSSWRRRSCTPFFGRTRCDRAEPMRSCAPPQRCRCVAYKARKITERAL